MATNDDNERLAREAAAIREETVTVGHTVGALEFHEHPRDRLAARLSQADALLCATFGEPGEGWRLLSAAAQEHYLWAAFDLIRAARGDLACLDAEAREARAGGAA